MAGTGGLTLMRINTSLRVVLGAISAYHNRERGGAKDEQWECTLLIGGINKYSMGSKTRESSYSTP